MNSIVEVIAQFEKDMSTTPFPEGARFANLVLYDFFLYTLKSIEDITSEDIKKWTTKIQGENPIVKKHKFAVLKVFLNYCIEKDLYNCFQSKQLLRCLNSIERKNLPNYLFYGDELNERELL